MFELDEVLVVIDEILVCDEKLLTEVEDDDEQKIAVVGYEQVHDEADDEDVVIVIGIQ